MADVGIVRGKTRREFFGSAGEAQERRRRGAGEAQERRRKREGRKARRWWRETRFEVKEEERSYLSALRADMAAFLSAEHCSPAEP